MLEIKLMAIHETITEQRNYFGDVTDIVFETSIIFMRANATKAVK